MVIPVGVDLHAHTEALQAQVEVRTHSALYTHCVANILLAVVAVVQCPARSHRHAPGILYFLWSICPNVQKNSAPPIALLPLLILACKAVSLHGLWPGHKQNCRACTCMHMYAHACKLRTVVACRLVACVATVDVSHTMHAVKSRPTPKTHLLLWSVACKGPPWKLFLRLLVLQYQVPCM